MIFRKHFLILLVLVSLISCVKFKEKNELALPPFFREEYEQQINKK